MFSRFRRLLSSDLIQVSFWNAIATLIRMLTGMISVKVVAAVIGPSGIALVGQLNNFSLILQSISSGGINAGVTKYVSEYSEEPSEYRKFLRTSIFITLVLSVVTGLVLLFGARYFAQVILHDASFAGVFYFFAFTIVLYALNALLISVINGFREFKKFVIANISGSLIGLVFSVVLALRYGVYGALVSAVTFQSVVFFATLWIVRKSDWYRKDNAIPAFDALTAKKLAHFALMAYASAITIPAGQLLVRGFITSKAGLDAAGIWEGMNRISAMYLNIITTSLAVYFLPKIAQLKERTELRKEIAKIYKLIIPFLLVATVAIYLMRHIVIRILFTKAFSDMQDLFSLQLMGDFMKILGWVLGYMLIAKAMTRVYVVMELVNFVLLTGSSYFLVDRMGVRGAQLSYLAVYIVYFIVLLYVFRGLLFSGKQDKAPTADQTTDRHEP